MFDVSVPAEFNIKKNLHLLRGGSLDILGGYFVHISMHKRSIHRYDCVFIVNTNPKH